MSSFDRKAVTEKAALERRIDELCQEVERLQADQAHWELGNCPSCPNIADLQEALEQNTKLRELCADIYKRFRGVVFECWAYSSEDFRMYERRMRNLGIEVPA